MVSVAVNHYTECDVVKWIEARVIYDAKHEHQMADLISDIFYDLGLEGVLLEDPEFERADGWDETSWADETLEMPAQLAVVGYFPKDDQVDERCWILGDRMETLEKNTGVPTHLFVGEMDDQDWTETWKEYFRPQRITRRITVKPTWRDYDGNPGESVINIDPGMAFGTGTHPTSHLCIQMIETYLDPGDAFLDIGTGSGILLIAAAMLGSERGLGIDIDEDAVEITRQNLALNQIDGESFRVRAGSYIDDIEDRFDFAAANLLPNAVAGILDTIQDVLVSGGIFVCSGVLEEHRDWIVERMRIQGFKILDIRVKETWVAIAGQLGDKPHTEGPN